MNDNSDDSDPQWSVVQACVWIATGSENLVGLVEGPGLRRVGEGRISGDSLEAADLRCAIRAGNAYNPDLYISGPACEALTSECRKGRLIASGCKNAQGDAEPLPINVWARVAILDASGGRPIRAAMPNGDATATWWSDLLFPARHVRRLWPHHGPRDMVADDLPTTLGPLPVKARPKAGRKPVLFDRVFAFLQQHYPDGKPDAVSYDMIRADLAAVDASFDEISDKTIRRALRAVRGDEQAK